MGTVYKAEDTKLRRAVALKFLAPELTRDEDAKRRFIHEAQAASALDHPNICSIFDVDETPEGQLFIAMACYEGESLKDRVARRRLDVREAFEIAFSVAQGLGRAHAANIIHRDIKPANVMITTDGFVKIVDFGLAKLIGRSRVTGSGTTLGTVAYMSPEQARSEEVDARADVWALGVVLYEMLTGQLPFRGDIGQAMVYSILNETPRPIRELRPEVPDACAAIVMKCLEKDPARRYQSAVEFCDAVRSLAGPLGWSESFTASTARAIAEYEPRRRSRAVVWMLVGAASVIVVFAAVKLWRSGASSSDVFSTQSRIAVLPIDRIGDAPSRSLVAGMSWWLADAVDRAGRTAKSTWVMPYEHVVSDRPAVPTRLKDAFGVNRIVVSEVTPYGAGFRLSLTLTDAATMKALRFGSVDFSLDSLDQFPARLAPAVVALMGGDTARADLETIAGHASRSPGACAGLFEAMGHLQQWRAGDNVERAIALMDSVMALDPGYADARVAMGLAHYRMFRRTKSVESARRAEAWLTGTIALDSTLVASYLWLSSLLERTERADSSVVVLRTAVRLDRGRIASYEELGEALMSLQRYGEAEDVYHELERQAPDYYYVHWKLGVLHRQMGRADREIREHEIALSLAPEDFRSLNDAGLHYANQGDWPRARGYWERAFLVKPDCATCSNVGGVLYFEGRFKEATRYFEYAFEYCDTTTLVVWANLANSLYRVDGEMERSKRMFRRAIELGLKHLEQTPDDLLTVARLADFYSMIGDSANAFHMVDRAVESDESEAMFRVAQVYENFGERTRALHYAGEALRRQYPLHEIMNEPMLKDLTRDPRFTEMVKGEGLSDSRPK